MAGLINISTNDLNWILGIVVRRARLLARLFMMKKLRFDLVPTIMAAC